MNFTQRYEAKVKHIVSQSWYCINLNAGRFLRQRVKWRGGFHNFGLSIICHLSSILLFHFPVKCSWITNWKGIKSHQLLNYWLPFLSWLILQLYCVMLKILFFLVPLTNICFCVSCLSADGMLFGALASCPICSGSLHYSGGEYRCHGYVSAWSKCSYSTTEPVRLKEKWKIPRETSNEYLIKVCQ